MSTDAVVIKELLETLEDGKEGFAKGAEKLAEGDHPEYAEVFRRLSGQRQQFSVELRQVARIGGDAADEGGSIGGTLHRGWLTVKDVLNGSSPNGVLEVAQQGDEHAIKEYEKALAETLAVDIRAVVTRQAAEVRAAYGEVQALLARQD